HPELRTIVDRNTCGAVHGTPYPRHEIAPVVEVEVRDRDRIDVRPTLTLTEATQYSGPTVDEETTAVVLHHVPRMGAAGVGPRRRGADDAEFHRRILPMWSGRYAS